MVKCAGPLWLVVALLLSTEPSRAGEAIRLANHPALSPDGITLAFDWDGDVWRVPVMGGTARRLTNHPARDREPRFSPDGKQIAFVSERTGSHQVHVMPVEGGTPRQLTFHTAGCSLQEWCPDGRRLLINASRDHFWRHPERFFTIEVEFRRSEHLLFDDYGQNGCLSPDGKSLLFTREGPPWWRKGYHGSQASQIWRYDLESMEYRLLLAEGSDCRWPLWRPDGKGFYYVSGRSGSFNLWERDLGSKKSKQRTRFTDDSVVFPCLSRDGSTLVFRHLFDLYCFCPGKNESQHRIDIRHDSDPIKDRVERRVLREASEAAFTADGLEIAFIAGGDLWVMDTELREPRQVTATPEEEKHPLFSPDGRTLLFVADRDACSDIFRAVPSKRTDTNRHWWQHGPLSIERLTDDGEVKSNLRFSPDGSRIAYLRARGDLWISDADGRNAHKLVPSWNELEYDWSPDGKWLVYAQSDSDFNRDIWIIPADGSRKPFNLSRHPYNDGNPVWSSDGRLIAFNGRRGLTEVDIHYVWLRAEDDEKSSRERAVEKAIEKINKVRNKPRESGETKAPAEPSRMPEVVIDFENIHRRIHRISITHTTESGLFWSPDSRKLAFTATVDGRRGTFTVDIPDDLKPKLLTTQTGAQARWLKQGNQLVWLSNGLPASFSSNATRAAAPVASVTRRTDPATGEMPVSAGDSSGGYRFQALQRVELSQRNRAAFDLCWRTMRDHWYDQRLGNRDWPAIRRKYADMAAAAPDSEAFTTVVQLMLGELNGSHLGFYPPGTKAYARYVPPPTSTAAANWSENTAHLGVRFQPDFEGPGLKIRDVLPGGPASRKISLLHEGDVILKIDDIEVNRQMDLTRVLNGSLPRDVSLHVRDKDNKERDVTVRPITYEQAQPLLYQAWLDGNWRTVDRASKGALGYLHISVMDAVSFSKFEQQLYAVGAGKDGLVIDVRENGGGNTADHLLTALTQPVHAITVPRGGEPGYPHDRKIYATWNKPIVVLCNQNSFSNAEIFSHAIKTLKRGQLVGVPTAGGVISTGAERIMDVGVIRVPFRGWFLIDSGADMELNGAVPDHVLWPKPGHMTRGEDEQLMKAIEVLKADVSEWKQRPRAPLRKSSERTGNEQSRK